MQKIDVEQIMAEIRAEIEEKGYKEEDLKFQDIPIPAGQGKDNGRFNADELLDYYNAYNKNWNNPMLSPYTDSNPVKRLVKKALYKISKCVFWPIVNYQNQFNSDVVRALNQLKYYVDADSERAEAIRRKIWKEVEKAKKELKKEIGIVKEEVRQAEKEIEQIKKGIGQTEEAIEQEKKEVGQVKETIEQLYKLVDERVGTISRQLMDVKWKQLDEIAHKKEKDTDVLRCDICGYEAQRGTFKTKETKCIFNGGELVRYACPECGVIFGPTKFMDLPQEKIDEDYKVHYYGYSEALLLGKEIEAFYMLHPNRDGIYLNYGCGCWSKSIQQLRADGYNVYGYEPYAPESDNPYVITSEEELVKMKFDGIYSNDLLEHLIDPVKDLRFMKTLLMHPDSKMAHSTACYIYKYENTRFHTHFFTGDSVKIMSEKAGLKIVEYRDAMEERDFICYVFAGESDRVDYKPRLYVSEYGERKAENIILHEKGLICGPYMVLGKGKYRMLFIAELKGRESITLKITAEKGKKDLFVTDLKNGDNNVLFTLEEQEEDVEFVIKNNYTDDVIIKEISMF